MVYVKVKLDLEKILFEMAANGKYLQRLFSHLLFMAPSASLGQTRWRKC